MGEVIYLYIFLTLPYWLKVSVLLINSKFHLCFALEAKYGTHVVGTFRRTFDGEYIKVTKRTYTCT